MPIIKKPTADERKATQNSFIKETLSAYRNKRLSSALLEEILKKIRSGMKKGSRAWAFKERYTPPALRICATCRAWNEKTGECGGEILFPASMSSVLEYPRRKMAWDGGKNCPVYQ